MHKAVGWLVWFGMVSISAGEIVAWKVPLERYFQPLAQGKLLEKPPEASPFFGPGDELREVKPRGKSTLKVEWVVWNETTGTLVTKSSAEELWPLLRFLAPENLPHQCRLRVDVYDTTGDTSSDPDAKPASTSEWITRSKRKSSVTNGVEEKRIELEAEVTLDETGEFIDLTLEGAFRLPGQDRLEMKTNVELKSGTTVTVVGDHSGGKGMEVKVTASTVLMDGSPLTDLIRIQRDGQVAPFYQPRHSFERHRIDGKMWLLLGAAELDGFIPAGETDDMDDPFSESAGNERERRDRLETTSAPASIAGHVHGPVLDIRELLAGVGIEVVEGRDFAGYDLIGQTVVFLTPSDQEADKLQQFLAATCYRPLRNILASCEDAGRSHVTSRSTLPAYVARGASDDSPLRKFAMEPLMDENGFLDIQIQYSNRSSQEFPPRLETSVVVASGRPLEINGEGWQRPLKITGTILEQQEMPHPTK